MSDKKDSPPLDFSALDLMPEWAQEFKKNQKRPSEKPRRDHDFRDRKGERGSRHDKRTRQGNRRSFDGRDRGDSRRDRRREGGRPGRRDHGGRERGGGRRREAPVARGFALKFGPTPKALSSLNQHIRDSFRTYPVIDLAKIILNSRELYQIEIQADSRQESKLFQCQSDKSVWLSREEAVSHFLGTPDCLNQYYAVEEVATGPPKGSFSVVAVCGMSGTILGPPNHHEYQAKIARLHAEHFSHMTLDGFKSRIHMTKEEEVIEKWKEQVSRTLHYRLKSEESEESEEASQPQDESSEGPPQGTPADTGREEESETGDAEPAENEPETDEPASEIEDELNENSDSDEETEESEESGEEPVEKPAPASEEKEEDTLLLKTQEELRRHFLENFVEEEIRETDSVTVNGTISGKLLSRGLFNLIRKESEQLRRGFPLPMIQAICDGLEKYHLRFFKRGKKSLHVSATRPKSLEESVVLTERIQQIVDLISRPQRCDVSTLLETMVEGFEKPKSREEAARMELSDAAKEILTDLRWLTSEGLVLEFPDTRLVLGKSPQSFPQKKRARKKAANSAPAKKEVETQRAEASDSPGESEVSPHQETDGDSEDKA